MSNDSNTTDPRIAAGAEAWDKHMGGRYAPHEVEELAEEVAVILAAADSVDPRKPRTITTVEELDALPDGSVALGWAVSGRTVYLRTMSARGRLVWGCVGDSAIHESGELLKSGAVATVLHEPEAEATR